MDIIKYQTQKAVAHAQRAPQLFGFGLFITFTYLLIGISVVLRKYRGFHFA